MFGEAKEGAVEAHDFSSSMSITTTHSKNENNSESVVSQKTLAKLVFSVGTSKITSDGSGEEETDEDDGSDYKEEGAAKSSGVEIEGMQMLTREQSGLKDKSEGNDQHGHALEDAVNMNNATAKLNLSSVDEEQSMEEDEEEEEEEFNDAMEREVDSEVDTTYVVQRGDLTDLSFDVDPDSEDE